MAKKAARMPLEVPSMAKKAASMPKKTPRMRVVGINDDEKNGMHGAESGNDDEKNGIDAGQSAARLTFSDTSAAGRRTLTVYATCVQGAGLSRNGAKVRVA